MYDYMKDLEKIYPEVYRQEWHPPTYALYDSRYYAIPERAVIYCFASTIEEALAEKCESFTDAVIVKMHVPEEGVLVADYIVLYDEAQAEGRWKK